MMIPNNIKTYSFVIIFCFGFLLISPWRVNAQAAQQQPSFDDLLNQQLSPDESESPFLSSTALEEDVLIDPNFLKDDELSSFDDYPKVSIRILDKITAQSQTYELEIGKTVAYGGLRIRPQNCKKAPPIEEPESTSFLQIWEKKKSGDGEWIFSGWMFASSPSLSAMEHPVYDVWVIDCAGDLLEEEDNSDISAQN